MPLPPIFVDLDSVVFIQEDGPCSGYAAMPCHAIDSTSIGRTDATRVYCKDPGKRGERVIARTVPGRKEPGTLTISAWSQEQSDLLHRMWQKNCMFGAQTHLDQCGLPTDITAYTKILDYYGIMPGTIDYSNMDNLEGGEGTGLQLALSCTYDDLIEVLKIALNDTPATYTLANADVMSVTGDLTERCASDCGVDRARCEIVIATTGMVGAATGQCWYSTDSGITWAGCGVATPFAGIVDVSCSTIIDTRWIVFGGTPLALHPRCSITDNNGGAWTEVGMGGAAADDYVTSCYQYDAGNVWACGGSNVAASGHVWFSSDRGDTWTVHEDVNASQVLNDIATADGDTIYAVGDANTVIKSTDQGATWTALTGPAASAINLQCVRALTNNHVLIGGNIDSSNEQLWCSLDGGVTWTAITFTGSTTAATWTKSLDLAPQAPRQHVWMVHGLAATGNDSYVFRSLDGGYTWERWAVLANDRYWRIFACDSNNAWIGGDQAGGLVGDIHHAAPVT